MGPSRILVLGPDSSLGPLIFAAIAPLVVAGDDPGKAVVLAGMMALLVGLIEIVLGVARLGFVADLLSKEVQVGYMNGLAITIVVAQLPKLCGFSTDADGFVDELRAFVRDFGERDRTTILLGLTTLAVLLVLPRISRRVPAVLVAVVGSTVVTAAFGLAVKTVGPLPQGLPHPAFPWTSAARRDPPPDRRGRHHARLADRHHRHLDQLRRPPWRRGRPEPGDDRPRDGEPGGGDVPGLRRVLQQLPDGGRRAVGREDPADRPGRRGVRRAPAPVLQLAPHRSAPDGARRGRDRGRDLVGRHPGARPLRPRPDELARPVAGGDRRCRVLRRAGRDRDRHRALDPAVLPAQLVAARGDPRPGGLDR